MDPRRLLILASTGLPLAGCAALRPPAGCEAAVAAAAPAPPSPAQVSAEAGRVARPFTAMAAIPDPPARPRRPRPHDDRPVPGPANPGARGPASGRGAIAWANLVAREPSRAEGFVGGVQVFAYGPGRVYEVWTAPLRVTTLTLGPGETIVSKAAGDTIRWRIGETTSGSGERRRAHVMIKPLRRGLETNLVLATSERVYLIRLRSGLPRSFNAAVAWDAGAVAPPPSSGAHAAAAPPRPPQAVAARPLDARFRIVPLAHRPAWTPVAVMTDGVRTYLRFPPELAAREAPALFVIGPGGGAELVNYRQQDGLWIVDRVFDEAELRLGDRRSQVVRILRAEDRP